MVVVFIKNYDIYKVGQQYTVERTLGARFCKMKVAVPYTVHLDNLAKEKEKAEAEAAKKAKAEKLLKEKEEKAMETADSKPAKMRSKSIKK